MPIVYTRYKDIDKAKWDKCIAQAANNLIYARSAFLDAQAEHWDALILEDYAAVMPLPWKRKFGVRYLYQPTFLQQSGIFSRHNMETELQAEFINHARAEFRFAEIALNYKNHATGPDGFVMNTTRANYVLSLIGHYESIYDSYDPSFTKSLRRIKKFGHVYQRNPDPSPAIELYMKLYAARLSASAFEFEGLMRICAVPPPGIKVIVRQANSDAGNLLAVTVLLQDATRLYNIISCITTEGKRLEANYFLYDKIIEEFSGTGLVLDMEGSDHEGIAAFYKKLQPVNEPYPMIKFNDLPFFMKIFKR